MYPFILNIEIESQKLCRHDNLPLLTRMIELNVGSNIFEWCILVHIQYSVKIISNFQPKNYVERK